MNQDFKDAVDALKKATAADKKYTKDGNKDARLIAIALFKVAEEAVLKVIGSKAVKTNVKQVC